MSDTCPICNRSLETDCACGEPERDAHAIRVRDREIASLRTQLAEANARAEKAESDASLTRIMELTLDDIELAVGYPKDWQKELAKGLHTHSIGIAEWTKARIDRLRAQCAAWKKWNESRYCIEEYVESKYADALTGACAACDAHGDLDQKPHAEGAD